MTDATVDPGTLLSLRNSIRSCTDCDLRKTASSPVPWRGDTHPDILVIGEAPGPEEDKYGKPFIGSAGIQLNTMLRESGLAAVATVAFANSCQCYPGRGMNAKSSTDVSYINACRKWMRAQVAAIQPQFVLAVGTIAFRSIWGDLTWPTLNHLHGKPVYWDNPPLPARPTCVWHTWHPSSALRSAKYKKLILADLRALRSWVDTGEVWPFECMIGECRNEFSSWDKEGRGIGLCEMHEMRQGELFGDG